MIRTARTTAEVEARIEKMRTFPRDDLEKSWIRIHGCNPPKGVKRRFLERAIAYHLQTTAFGGLRPRTFKALMAVLAGQRNVGREGSAISSLRPGSRLVREWNGRSHHVHVLENGFAFKGRVYRSLSAIAREITGARWSGPRFFGT